MRYLNINCDKWRMVLEPLGERQRGAVLNALYIFSQTGEIKEPRGAAATVFLAMLPDLKRARGKALGSEQKNGSDIEVV